MCWQSTNLSRPREAKCYPEKGFAVSRIPKLSEMAFVREQTTSNSVSLRSQDYDGTDSLHAVVMELWKHRSTGCCSHRWGCCAHACLPDSTSPTCLIPFPDSESRQPPAPGLHTYPSLHRERELQHTKTRLLRSACCVSLAAALDRFPCLLMYPEVRTMISTCLVQVGESLQGSHVVMSRSRGLPAVE